MKKKVILLAGLSLIFMSLVYAGVFRDNQDPLAVTRYYLECLKNREGFLTFQISAPRYFNEDRYGELYNKYNLGDLTGMNLTLEQLTQHEAVVLAHLVYKNIAARSLKIILSHDDNRWFIDGLSDEL